MTATVPLGSLSERAEYVVPTYQYQCTECGAALEVIQSFSDDALTECPECTGRLRKVFNAVGVVFKGSGFYRNDSRQKSTEPSKNGSAKGDSKSSSGTPADSSSSGSSSSDSSSTSTPTPASTGG
jgi:putative FmdB family regulatory protein